MVARAHPALRREVPAAEQIPYLALLTPHVLYAGGGNYVQTFRLAGGSFECADDAELNNWHQRLNVLWRNIASPQLAVWTHIVRRREWLAQRTGPVCGFADRLQRKYQQRLSQETLMVNELYLSLVYRPTLGMASNLVSRVLARRNGAAQLGHSEALDACEKLAQSVQASLARYEPSRLGSYREHGRWHSALLEFLGLLVNAEQRRMPLPRSPINHALPTSRLFFGGEAIEYRGINTVRVGAVLGIKEYPTPSVVGMFDRLLSAPFAFVLTQSFAFLSKAAAQGLLRRQMFRMENAGDYGVSQTQQLSAALDALTSNEFVMGDHHFSLQVLAAPDVLAVGEGPEARLRTLNDQVALARNYLADSGMTVAREDMALEAAFWAQLPGAFSLRSRKAPITSRNFCAMAAFHNYPCGRAQHNHWGEALAVLITSARSAYHFSLHASDPKDPDGGSRKDTGHTLICGPTGSGKTVFIGFLIAVLSRRAVTQVVFDKDRGLEILIRALDGAYLPLRNGIATGFNPLRLPPTATHVEFLKGWLRCLVQANASAPLGVQQQMDLDQALQGTLALQPGARRLSRLIEFLDATDPEGMYARLVRWCSSTGGDYAWVFDNVEDTIAERLSAQALIGFDVSEFLDHAIARTPITLYLFHLVRQLLDGRRLVCWMDEFWRLLADPAFESFAKDAPKTWRKLNGVMCLATQSASDVLDSPIARTLIEQTPTKVLFPNAAADFGEYADGFGLSEREFRLLKERLEPGSRSFLLKQGHHSIVCQLDLKGFEAELKVISGRAAETQRMHKLIEQWGTQASLWLPHFLGEVVEA